jgi:hypothetical protein
VDARAAGVVANPGGSALEIAAIAGVVGTARATVAGVDDRCMAVMSDVGFATRAADAAGSVCGAGSGGRAGVLAALGGVGLRIGFAAVAAPDDAEAAEDVPAAVVTAGAAESLSATTCPAVGSIAACALVAAGVVEGIKAGAPTVAVVLWPAPGGGGTVTVGSGMGVGCVMGGGGAPTAGVGVAAVEVGVVAVGVLTPPATGGRCPGRPGSGTVADGRVIVNVGLVTVTDGVVATPPPPGAGSVTAEVVVVSGAPGVVPDTAPVTVAAAALTTPPVKADPSHPPSTSSEIRATGAETARTSMLHLLPRGPTAYKSRSRLAKYELVPAGLSRREMAREGARDGTPRAHFRCTSRYHSR